MLWGQVRALRERNTAIKRKACIIIHNMSKLVYNPAEAAPFLPRLLPEVKKVRALAGLSCSSRLKEGMSREIEMSACWLDASALRHWPVFIHQRL